MNDRDELRELWIGQPSGGNREAQGLLALVQGKTKRFDLVIATRNLIECAAAILVVVFFARFALVRAENGLARAGSLMVAAGAAWIIYYLLRYGREPATPDLSQNLASYTSALMARYDHQIRLLKSAKYWYLLPMYVGLLVASAGGFLERARLGTFGWRMLAGPAVYTAVFAVVWWLNEVNGVGRLKEERARLLSITGTPSTYREPS